MLEQISLLICSKNRVISKGSYLPFESLYCANRLSCKNRAHKNFYRKILNNINRRIAFTPSVFLIGCKA